MLHVASYQYQPTLRIPHTSGLDVPCTAIVDSWAPQSLSLRQVTMANLHYRITWSLPRPSGGQLLLVLYTKCMEMTAVVNKIACRLYTMCPPAIVLRLSIADTLTFATVYSQYIKGLCTWQNTANSTAMIAKQRLDWLKTDLHGFSFDS